MTCRKAPHSRRVRRVREAPFYSQAALVHHKRLEHGGVIACPHCDKTLTWAQHRDAHVKNKHDTETANKCACGASHVKKWQLERHEQE